MGSTGKSNNLDTLDTAVSRGDTHTFKGKASSSHTYEYAGTKEMLEYFKNNSNYDDLLSHISAGGSLYMRSWTEGHFMDGQQYRGWDNMRDSDKARTQFYDKLIDQSQINTGFSVVRRATTELLFGKKMSSITEADLQKVLGTIIKSRGHMSTGAGEEGLTIGHGYEKPIEYKFFTTGATTGVGMYIGDGRVNEWKTQQREVMLNRDTLWQPTGYSYDSNRKVWVVDMKYVGKERHDYGKSGMV